MSLLSDSQDGFGGPRQARFPDWATDTLPADLDASGHRISNVKFDRLGTNTVHAADYCAMDSDIVIGGGTSDTEPLQDILDSAEDYGGLSLIIEKPMLIDTDDTGPCLTIRSNTRLIFSPGAGMFIAPECPAAYLIGSDLSAAAYGNTNIEIWGGIFNGNGYNQINRNGGMIDFDGNDRTEVGYTGAPKSLLFFNRVERLRLWDLLIQNAMVYSLLIQESRNLRGRVQFLQDNPGPFAIAMNHDGLHFHGPIDDWDFDLVGNGDDDILALNTNEHMGEGDSRRANTPTNGAITRGRARIYMNGGAPSIRKYAQGARGKIDDVEIEVRGHVNGTRYVWETGVAPASTAGAGVDTQRFRIKGYDVYNDAQDASGIENIRLKDVAELRIDGVASHVSLKLQNVAECKGDAFNGYESNALPSGLPVSLVSATAKRIISVSLPAGDWVVGGNINFIIANTTVVAYLIGAISETDNTLPSLSEQQNIQEIAFTSPAQHTRTIIVPLRRVSLTAAATVYLVAKASFATSTMTAYGAIWARSAPAGSPQI